jgi:hypothetical protein
MTDIEPTTIEPTLERPHPTGTGTQRLYRFDNGLGASVIQFEIMPGVGSYGAGSGHWELAVLRFTGENLTKDFHLAYDTPITDDVIGHLDDAEVQDTLRRIRDLPGDGPIRVDSQLGAQPAIEAAQDAEVVR